MIKVGVEPVLLQPGGVIDHRPAAAQLLHEDIIAEPLRGLHISVRLRQSDLKICCNAPRHRPILCPK